MASWKILLTAAGALLAAGASAADSGWLNAIDRAAAPKEAPNVRVELIAQNKALTPQAKNTLAVVFHHEPGWHTYWRMPGEAGLPTSFSFVTPNGFQAHTPSFPLPERFLTSGLVTYGYGGETIFPFQLDVPRRTAFGSRQTVTVNVSFLACKDVCVPGEASASIRLPVAVRPDPGPNAARIQAAERLIPEVVANEHVTATIEENRLRIDVPAQTGKIAESLTFFPLAADAMDIKVEPVLRRHEDGSSELHLRAADVFAGAPRETLDGLLIADGGPEKGGWAVEMSIPVTKGVVEPLPATAAAAGNTASQAGLDSPQGPSLTAWTAVSVCDAVQEVCGVRPGIKWVNDLILSSQKVGGILTELSVEAESGHVQYVVVGIGLNVNTMPQDLPAEVRGQATSLAAEIGRTVPRAELAAALIRRLDRMREDWPSRMEEYRQAYRADSITVGRAVCVQTAQGMQKGTAEAIQEDFSLLVRRPDGTPMVLNSGEVSVRGLCGYLD